MIEAMKRKNHGVDLFLSMTLSLINLYCFPFVDDTDLSISARTRHTKGESIIKSFQEALDYWARLLAATGGELGPLKLCFVLINFPLTGDDWQYKIIENMPAKSTLNMKDIIKSRHV